ncbi:ROK family transcriptional regulator [Nocardioides anomalus]|uniref:ROK family transcriptional regulator n=1 Tax=Nocardioides anomalus TaxID=2712223 RepID=A0A6G6WBD5_9ACTN|nr:ROK family transcriptional regulator [Nocardioides anomalus]QIG42350.1 ROK family transcriptional regulator [Nocardioides anomalus]
MASSGALERLRAGNSRTVLGLLAGEGPMSRADLVRASGLSRTTVSSLVADLIRTGQVSETDDKARPHKGGSGRPPVLVRLSAPAGGVAGVDIGHGHVRVAVSDRAGTILAEEHALVDVDSHGAEVLDRTATTVRALLARSGLHDDELQAVGMCVPAPVDRRSSRIRTGIMPGWQGLLPGEELERRLGVPVHADNDANLGALAELHHGIARGRHDVVYLKIASGVGAGIVLGGRLHRGTSGIAGEIGHVQVGEEGHVCRCGNRGCLETRVSAAHLLEALRPAYDEPLSIDQVIELDRAGDPGVRRVLTDAGLTIGRAVADLANSLNPELVVVGGTLGGSPSLIEGLRLSIDRYAQPDTASSVEVVPGALGVRSAVVGAVALAIARVAV